MKDMKLSVKLIGAFIIVSIITVCVGVIGIYNIRAIDKAGTAMYEENTKPLVEIARVAVGFQSNRNLVRDAFIQKFAYNKDIGEHIQQIKDLDQKGLASVAKFGESIREEDLRKELDVLK